MKITRPHYEYMRDAMRTAASYILTQDCYVARNPSIPRIENTVDPVKRYRWDLAYAAKLSPFMCEHVYKYANDDHIDTALKAIVKELAL